MSKQRVRQRERQAARAQRVKARQRKSIAGGRWRSGPHKTADRRREADRIDGCDRDDLGENLDY
jgi:hypothetical protein